jgi:predicted nuclease with TOPRIM domain
LANTNKKTVYTRIQNKLDLEVNWKKAVGFIPLAGELVIYGKEVDADGKILELPEGRSEPFKYERYKIGDGVTNINDLPFMTAEADQIVFTGNFTVGAGKEATEIQLKSKKLNEVVQELYTEKAELSSTIAELEADLAAANEELDKKAAVQIITWGADD